MDRQTLRDWAHRFNDEGADGLKNRPGAGRPRLLTDEQMGELSVIVETGPDPEIDGVVRWRRVDLKRVIEERFGVIYSERAISDLLVALSFSHISARPQHPKQDQRVIEAFKKNFHRTLAAHLEHYPTIWNLRGFPRGWISDSRCGLEKEASLDDETSFQRPSKAACLGG